jgi:hypothetical protein
MPENLAITTTYFQALPQNDVINAVRSRPVPQVNAMATVDQLALPPAPLVEVLHA